MPFENEVLRNAYAAKIDASKKGVDILFKKTIEILQPDKVEQTNSTLKNVDVTIRDKLSIANKKDLFEILMSINQQTLRSYFLKLDELFKQKAIDSGIIIQFINEMLDIGTKKQLEAMGRLPEALLVLTIKILKQLPASPNGHHTIISNAHDAMVRLAKSVYAVDAACYENFSKKLVAAAHTNEISYYQLFQFMEQLLDEEFQTHMKANTYLRTSNIITNMLVKIIPAEDRAGFILLISAPFLNYVNTITLLQIKRAAHCQPKFNLAKEREQNEKLMAMKRLNNEPSSSSEPVDDLSELIEKNAKNIQEIITILSTTAPEKIPPFVKTVCQLITNNLLKNLPKNLDNSDHIVIQVSSFITNKLFASLCLEWLKEKFPTESEYLDVFTNLILKPLQTLVTNFQADNHKPDQLPELIKRLIIADNRLRLLTFGNRIIQEIPSTLQKLCLIQKDYQVHANSLPVVTVRQGTPPKQRNTVTLEDNDEFSSSSSSDEEDNKEKTLAQPKTAAPITSIDAVLSPSKRAVQKSPLLEKVNNTELAVCEMIPFDKTLDENEIELRLMIIFEECLALAKKLNIADNLPSQSTVLPKMVHQKLFTPAPLTLPSRKNMSDDLIYISQKLAQIESDDRKKLIELYKALDAAVCSLDAYKTYNVAITKAGLVNVSDKTQPQGLVNVPLNNN